MHAPDLIQVNWNGADTYDYLVGAGIDVRPRDYLSPRLLTEILAAQAGSPFVLLGRIADTLAQVYLRIAAVTDDGLVVASKEPPFKDAYIVAEEPHPYINGHADCIFHLGRCGVTPTRRELMDADFEHAAIVAKTTGDFDPWWRAYRRWIELGQ